MVNQEPAGDPRCLGRERRGWAAAGLELILSSLDEYVHSGRHDARVAGQIEPLHACLLATLAANLTHVGDND